MLINPEISQNPLQWNKWFYKESHIRKASRWENAPTLLLYSRSVAPATEWQVSFGKSEKTGYRAESCSKNKTSEYL